jgi:hypothetical protein
LRPIRRSSRNGSGWEARCGPATDPDKIFNAGLEGNLWRAIDFFEGDKVNARALKSLVRAAIDYNQSKLKKNAGARAKLLKSKKK